MPSRTRVCALSVRRSPCASTTRSNGQASKESTQARAQARLRSPYAVADASSHGRECRPGGGSYVSASETTGESSPPDRRRSAYAWPDDRKPSRPACSLRSSAVPGRRASLDGAGSLAPRRSEDLFACIAGLPGRVASPADKLPQLLQHTCDETGSDRRYARRVPGHLLRSVLRCSTGSANGATACLMTDG